MYLTPYQKKQLITVVVLVIGIPLTLFGIYKTVQWFTSAGTNTQPKNVILANLTTNSITVTWTTENKQTGSVVPILNSSEQNTVVDKRGTGRRYTHYVELKNLEPGTKYEFKIISGEDTYTNSDNNEFSFTTANISAETPIPKPIHGELEGNNGEDVLIYAFPKDKSTYPVVTVPSANGNWLIDLSSLRKVSDKFLYQVSDSTNLLLVASSGVDNAGTVEGTYGNIFDSRGQLTEILTSTGGKYDTYFSNESKLIASTEQNQETPTQNDEEPTIPDDTTDDEEFNREYELKGDLEWVDLVKSGSVATSPTSSGEDTVTITNLTDVSFTVIWYSENEETGYIQYGTDSNDLDEKGKDERDNISSQGEYFLHSVEITQLEPETKYYFKVYSGQDEYPEIYDITTFSTQSSPPQFETISGTTDVKDYESFVVIAYFSDNDEVGSLGNSYPISTLIDSEGAWILTIGGARDQDGKYFDKSNQDLVIFQPKYLTQPSEVETTVGEATSEEVELTVNENVTNFVRIPRLSDYGILVD
jgi:hypothetical protein